LTSKKPCFGSQIKARKGIPTSGAGKIQNFENGINLLNRVAREAVATELLGNGFEFIHLPKKEGRAALLSSLHRSLFPTNRVSHTIQCKAEITIIKI
jgi:hypothetical protein